MVDGQPGAFQAWASRRRLDQTTKGMHLNCSLAEEQAVRVCILLVGALWSGSGGSPNAHP